MYFGSQEMRRIIYRQHLLWNRHIYRAWSMLLCLHVVCNDPTRLFWHVDYNFYGIPYFHIAYRESNFCQHFMWPILVTGTAAFLSLSKKAITLAAGKATKEIAERCCNVWLWAFSMGRNYRFSALLSATLLRNIIIIVVVGL